MLEFPNASYTGSMHIGGVAWDPHTGLITIITDSAAPWATGGADVSGDHFLIKYHPHQKKIIWSLNITDLTQERYGGFQDVETDRRGNTYVVGTWPGTILRADRHGRSIKNWYLPEPLPPTTKVGFGGLVAVGGTSEVLLANDGDGQLYRFDMRHEVGTPVLVPVTSGVACRINDAIYLPPRYDGRVLLVACGAEGLQVLRSRDKRWVTAEYLGTVPNPTGPGFEGSVVTAAVQIGRNPGSIHLVEGYFDFP